MGLGTPWGWGLLPKPNRLPPPPPQWEQFEAERVSLLRQHFLSTPDPWDTPDPTGDPQPGGRPEPQP